jgi:hypothetical protein
MLQENNLPEWLVEEMISYLYTHELIIKSPDTKSVQHVPVSVFPSQVIINLPSFQNRYLKKLNFIK